MNSFFVQFLIGCCYLALYSCSKCEDIYCEGASEELKSFVTYAYGDSIIYTNDQGKKVSFGLTRIDIDFGEIHKCPEGGNKPFGGHVQEPCYPPSAGYGAYTSDTTRNIYDTIHRVFNQHLAYSILANTNSKLSFEIFGSSGNVSVNPLHLKANQIIIPRYIAGLNEYDNVLEHTVDTSKALSNNPKLNVYFVSKIYIQKQKGIIAFFDIQSNSLFYLQ